jgi:hypothetical protein
LSKASIIPHVQTPINLISFFPKRDGRFSGDERKINVSAYCLFLVGGGLGKAGKNLAYSSRAETAATSGIHPSIHPSKSSSHGECSVNIIWAAAATNNGQDLQVHEGVEGSRLEEDGDNIEHQVTNGV